MPRHGSRTTSSPPWHAFTKTQTFGEALGFLLRHHLLSKRDFSRTSLVTSGAEINTLTALHALLATWSATLACSELRREDLWLVLLAKFVRVQLYLHYLLLIDLPLFSLKLIKTSFSTLKLVPGTIFTAQQVNRSMVTLSPVSLIGISGLSILANKVALRMSFGISGRLHDACFFFFFRSPFCYVVSMIRSFGRRILDAGFRTRLKGNLLLCST